MRTFKRSVALLLSLMMLLTVAPLGVFATETTATGLVYESEIYEDETLAGYKQCEGMWTDSTYVKGDVKYTVYFDAANASQKHDVILYVINWNGERIGENEGEHSDVKIVYDNIVADPAVETGRHAAVIVVDFGGNPNAVAGVVEFSMARFRSDLGTVAPVGSLKLDKNYTFVLPAGYRVMRDVLYFQSDVHGSLGTLNAVMSTWNAQVAYNPSNASAASRYADGKLPKAVNYAWHTGDANCTCKANGAGNECFAGAPQEKNGEIIPYTNVITHTGDKETCPYPHSVLTTVSCKSTNTANINWAPAVTRVEDCRKPDGSPLNYNCRLDIVYPSAGKDEGIETPVFTQAATQSPRMNNIGTLSWKDDDKDGVETLKSRAAFVGFSFNGYTCAVYDYAYIPMARGDHYGYIDGYGFHGTNGAKTARAAIRCIRYFADVLGYSSELIGAAGISKGTPTTAVLSTVNNKKVVEQNTYKYVVNGETVETRGLYYEGDLNADGTVTAGRTQQPYMYYEDGYNTTSSTGTEISSEVSVVYCAAGDGINWTYNPSWGNSTILLGAIDANTGEETQHVPMVLSCGQYDEYGCWNHWNGIVNRFTEYAENPFLAIPMEDMGHDYPFGTDPIRNYDRYEAMNQFFHSILKPELYEAQVAWSLPVNGATDVSVFEKIQVQLIKPAQSLEAFIAATTVKDTYGNAVAGTWTTNGDNTSGLYTFVPEGGYVGGIEYKVTVGTPVVEETWESTFTTEALGFLRPVADTYVSALKPDGVFGAEKTVYIDKDHTYFVTFKTSDFEDANRAFLNLSVNTSGGQTLSVYVLDGYSVDEETLCYSNMPALTSDKLLSTYQVSSTNHQLDLLGVADEVSGEYFTLAIVGTADRYSYELNFEQYNSGDKVPSYNSAHNPDSSIGSTDIFHATWVLKESGATNAWKVTTDNGNKVATLSATTTNASGRMKFYNSIATRALTEADIGRTFDISFRAKAVGGAAKVGYGLMPGDSSPDSSTLKYIDLNTETWTEISGSRTLTADMVAGQHGLFTVKTATQGVNYLFDDFVITERPCTSLTSREDTSVMTTYIITETRPANHPVADTYVSKDAPDTAFGEDSELILHGGNAVFLTFPASILEGKQHMDIKLPVSNDAGVEYDLYLLDGYYVNEGTLTYNNMPDLATMTPIGSYKLTSGSNVTEVGIGEDDVYGTHFTLVLKAKESSFHYFYEDFEDGTAGSSLVYTSASVTVDGVTYYHGYSDTAFFRGGSGWGSSAHLKYAVDPADANNMVMASSTTSGRARLLNMLSYDDITAEDMDKYYRFSFRVKDADTTQGNVLYGIMKTKGDHTTYYISTTVNTVTNTKWTNISQTYKLSDIMTLAQATDPINPAFFIESTAYYYDDFQVLEVNSDGTEKRAIMCSVEGDEKNAATFRTRTDSDPVADTYVSAVDAAVNAKTANTVPVSDKTANFGQSEALYISGKTSAIGERVALISYSKKALSGGNFVNLDLPVQKVGS